MPSSFTVLKTFLIYVSYNYLADDEKSKEIQSEYAAAISSRAKEQELRGEPGVWKRHCVGTCEI